MRHNCDSLACEAREREPHTCERVRRLSPFSLAVSTPASNRLFARSRHMVGNKLCWEANNTVGLPKQRNSYQSSPARPFSIVLVKLAFNATRNSRKKPKNAIIMPDFFKKCHFNSKNALIPKRTNSYMICSYQQQVILNNFLFIKLGVRIKTFPANSH